MTFDITRARELMEHDRLYHSAYQMDNFITSRAGVTTYGMFVQALREMRSRMDGLKELATDHALTEIELERRERDAKRAKDTLDRREAQIKAGVARARLAGLLRNASETARELQRFYAQASALRAQLPTQLTPDVLAELERERWVEGLKRRAAVELRADGKVSHGTVESIWALPMRERDLVLAALRDVPAFVAACESYEVPLPAIDVPALDQVEAARMLEVCS